MQNIKVGLVGCGGYGNVHLDYLLTRGDVSVTALATTNVERLRKTGAKAPSARLYCSFDEMLAGEEALDAVVICIPPDSHGDIEAKAAGRGIHLFVEKPIDNSLEAAQKKADIIRASGIITCVGYKGRYGDGLDEMRRQTRESGIALIQGRWIGSMPGAEWWRDKARSGGQLVEQCTHIADLMRYFAGEAAEVYAAAHNDINASPLPHTADDSSAAVIRFKSGVTGTLLTGCFQDPSQIKPDIGLEVYCRDFTVRSLWQNGLDRIGARDSQPVHYPAAPALHTRAMDAFIDAVKTGDRSAIRSDWDDALETLRLTLALDESIATGAPVSL